MGATLIVFVTLFMLTSSTKIQNENVTRFQDKIFRLPVTMELDNESEEEQSRRIAEINGTSPTSNMYSTTLDDRSMELVREFEPDKTSKTLNTLADKLKSAIDKDECDCNPQDNAQIVKEIAQNAARVVENIFSQILDSLKGSISQREASLIKGIAIESLRSIVKSIDGIFSLWRSKQDEVYMQSAQQVVEEFASFLRTLASKTVIIKSASKQSKMATMAYVLNSIVKLVSNTALAVAEDIDGTMAEDQLDFALDLARDLAVPITSPVVAEFVAGHTRLPYINKMLLQYVLSSREISRGCEESRAIRVDLPRCVLQALSEGLMSINIRQAHADLGGIISEAYNTATSSFLKSLIAQLEDLTGRLMAIDLVSLECKRRVAESLVNIGEVNKKIIDHIILEFKEPITMQKAQLTGLLDKDLIDIMSVVGSIMTQSEVPISSITSLIKIQFKIVRLQSSNGRLNSTITTLVDVAHLMLDTVQSVSEKLQPLYNTNLRLKNIKDITEVLIESQLNTSNLFIQVDNQPLQDVVKVAGTTLVELMNIADRSLYGDSKSLSSLLYGIFYELINSSRRIVDTVSSRPGDSPDEAAKHVDQIVMILITSIRTTFDWSVGRSKVLGQDREPIESLVRMAIKMIKSSQTSLIQHNPAIVPSVQQGIQELGVLQFKMEKLLAPETIGDLRDERLDYSCSNYSSKSSARLTSIYVTLLARSNKALRSLLNKEKLDTKTVRVVQNVLGSTDILLKLFNEACDHRQMLDVRQTSTPRPHEYEDPLSKQILDLVKQLKRRGDIKVGEVIELRKIFDELARASVKNCKSQGYKTPPDIMNELIVVVLKSLLKQSATVCSTRYRPQLITSH